MNIFKLGWRNLINRPLSLFLSVLLFALGVGLISLLLLLNQQLEEKFENNLAGIDLVVGAKGSPLQLILCNMYHIDAPTGNIDIKDARALMQPGHPLIKKAIPLSLGDNYRNFRIVGTTTDFLDLYKANLATGTVYDQHFEVTVGAAVAEELDLKIGDTFLSAHGFDHDEDLQHEDSRPFQVVGILAPTGAVIDQLILTTPPTIWMVHDHVEEAPAATPEESDNHDDHEHEHDHDHGDDHDDHDNHTHENEGEHAHHDHEHQLFDQPLTAYPDKQITSLLIQFGSRNFRTLNMQRNINENTNMQAATPAIEINRLFSLMGLGLDTLRVLAWAIVIVSGFSIFISLLSSLKDRQYELALMRVMGASRSKLFLLIIIEGLIVAILGYLFGIMVSHASIEYLSGFMQETYKYSISGKVFLTAEWWLLLGSLGIGVVAAVIPAIQASRTDISETLAER